MDPAAQIAALCTVIGSMAGFIVYLFKRGLDDKDKELDERLAEQSVRYEAQLAQERTYRTAVELQRDKLFNLVVRTQDTARKAIEHIPTDETGTGKRT